MIKTNKNIGSWITTFNPSAAHLMSTLGFNWLCIDMEHSSITFDQMTTLITVIENNRVLPYVRVGSNDKLQIKKALDAGAKGIIVPMVNTVKDAKNAIDSTFYYPRGKRGVGLSRAQNFGNNFQKYIAHESKKIKLILQIESIEAINNLEKILNLKYISGTLIGPHDLASSLGVIGKLDNSKVKKAIYKYEKISKRKKIPMGIHIAQLDLNKIKKSFTKKYNFVAAGTDMIFLSNSCKDFLKKI